MTESNKYISIRLNNYNYYLKEYGIKEAQKYAEEAGLGGNYRRYLPECDPWRDHDLCLWSCNYYNTSLGCMLFHLDLNGGIKKYED